MTSEDINAKYFFYKSLLFLNIFYYFYSKLLVQTNKLFQLLRGYVWFLSLAARLFFL